MAATTVADTSVIPADGLSWRSERRVDQIYLGSRYLRLLDAHHYRPLHEVVPLLCAACDRTISYADQLLCTKRRWGLGGELPEAACFVNGIVSSSIEVRPSYEEHLAQGLMEMADVYCKCGTQVGYKFCADKTPTGRNQNQVGRYGLVCSRFTVAAYELSHSRLHAPESLATPPGTEQRV